MKEGKIVPPEVTIKLLLRAILESGNDKFLIDGFPRDEENRAAFENIVCKLAIYNSWVHQCILLITMTNQICI